jgi:hypothetical protein
MKLQELCNDIELTKASNENKLFHIKEQLENYNKNMAEKLETLKEVLPKVIVALKSKHLEIANISYQKTGAYISKSEPGVWTEGDSLYISLNLQPINDKFKFLLFKGYTSRGTGRNRSHIEKSNKLSSFIKNNTNIKRVYFNPYSLEIKNENERKIVLMDFWI